ncbi:SGNH/GDSL hydrolase family protein [Maribellus sp. YY47]|uniref:SGNH/GDSL hydrolase family protein n=1 Tax=Maribellus sp. YY47 TaxID=2929486 RepID=UPI0020016AA1|nr:SGNH/GDSL hydrolase family protein [Maribellus sp. YY47]MCK3685128.1 SGNH/GDSL hydrolase family protein [Maribellus sp. YY47]
MRTHIIIALLAVLQFQAYSQPYKIPDDVTRIVFLGNSITYQGKYIEYMEAYFRVHHPEKQYEFINVGLPSETVSGLSEENHAGGAFPRPDLHERLHRVLEKTKPDLVFANYGMNDGIYLEFDDTRFNKFREGILWLHGELEKTGAEIIHVTPPVFDERKGEAYANVLDIYSDWLISKRYTADWNVIDIHWPMRKELEKQRAADSTFVFAQDGVHPNDYGHFVMASEMLWYLGENQTEQSYDMERFLSENPDRDKILSLVNQLQVIMKDAWLTFTGHRRPWMKEGLPMEEAIQKSEEIKNQLSVLLSKE